MPNKKDEVEIPPYDEDVNEYADTQKAASEKRESANSAKKSRRTSDSRVSTKSSKDSESEDDTTKREPFTATLERGYKRRMNGMVHHAQTVGTPEKVKTISDYVNLAIAEKLARDEKRLNNGQPFPEPLHMRTGRPHKR